jgi:hypothetical protein
MAVSATRSERWAALNLFLGRHAEMIARLFKTGAVMMVVVAALHPHRFVAQTVVDRAIANANPCAGLKKKTVVGTVGIDRLKEVHVEEASAAMQGSKLKISFTGHLACRTSDSAAIRGDASAHISVTGEMSLTECNKPDLNVSLTDFGGSFGSIISLASSQIETSLRTAMADQWERACLTLTKKGG